jgi:hypothetical protein
MSQKGVSTNILEETNLQHKQDNLEPSPDSDKKRVITCGTFNGTCSIPYFQYQF